MDSISSRLGLKERVAEAPWAMVAAAVGVGYVLGGGLFTATSARLLRLGLKVASFPVVGAVLLDAVESAVDDVLEQPKHKEKPR